MVPAPKIGAGTTSVSRSGAQWPAAASLVNSAELVKVLSGRTLGGQYQRERLGCCHPLSRRDRFDRAACPRSRRRLASSSSTQPDCRAATEPHSRRFTDDLIGGFCHRHATPRIREAPRQLPRGALRTDSDEVDVLALATGDSRARVRHDLTRKPALLSAHYDREGRVSWRHRDPPLLRAADGGRNRG